jgi:hypothetical protein
VVPYQKILDPKHRLQPVKGIRNKIFCSPALEQDQDPEKMFSKISTSIGVLKQLDKVKIKLSESTV